MPVVDRARADDRLAAAAKTEISRRASQSNAAGGSAGSKGDQDAVPHQLPSTVRHFAGRAAELAMLSDLADDSTGPGGGVPVLAIGGAPGIGKTTLALRWAHQVSHRFPDGQLYVNLRGYDQSGAAMPPDEATYRFLEAFAVPAERIPPTLDGRSALYRSLLAGKRVLVVLDNAHDADQVRPLLPGTPGCLVVVTSRTQLASLIAGEGASWITLDLLSRDDAEAMLEGRLGKARLAAEPDAVDDIIARCARLPLALAIVAARAATRPRHPLAALAGELRDEGGGLDAYDGGSPTTDARSVFSWSYHRLSPLAAELFRLLGLLPGPDIGLLAVATLAAAPPATARKLLTELSQLNLIAEHAPNRYTFHDLLRAYATELAHAVDDDTHRRRAVHRLLDHYLHTAYHASLLLDAHRPDPVQPAPALPGVIAADIADHQQALSWFTAEQPALLAAIVHAAASGFETHTCQLVRNTSVFLIRRARWPEYMLAQLTALQAAEHLGDLPAQAHAHRSLGTAASELGHHREADYNLRSARRLFNSVGDDAGAAQTYLALSRLAQRQDDHQRALGYATDALALYRAAEHLGGQANALNSIGWCQSHLGAYAEAAIACEQAVELAGRLGDRWVESAACDSLGYAHHHAGNHAQAAACYERAAQLCRHLGAWDNEAETLIHLGDTLHASGSPAAARAAWQRALTIRTELDHPETEQVSRRLQDLDAPAA